MLLLNHRQQIPDRVFLRSAPRRLQIQPQPWLLTVPEQEM
jgi:hypothetical protein